MSRERGDTAPSAETPPGELRSFGRRRGRGGSPRKSRLFETLLPELAVSLEAPFSRAAHGAHDRPLWLEIGFGGGEHLLWQAAHGQGNPVIIGCEPFEDGVGKVLTAIDDAEHAASLEGTGSRPSLKASIRLHVEDARPLLRWLPDGVIDRAFVLFPDPWPKRKHTKRRLVAEPLLAELARVMRPGAELRVATDIPDYARTMLMAFQREQHFAWTAMTADDWRKRPQDWPQTKYETKAIREGRDRAYLSFQRV